MTELVKVYDTKGEAFELSIANAQDAEAHLGWTRNPPAKPFKAAVEAAVKVEAPVVAAATEAPVEEAPVEDAAVRGRPKKL
jgi:hypothetical protein